MTKIETYCDKCGAELHGVDNYEDTHIDIAWYLKRVDLCPACLEKLTDMIDGFFSKESEDTE